MLRVAVLLTLLLLCTSAILALPTGLNVMPTTNTLGLGDMRFDYEPEHSEKLFVPNNGMLAGNETGLALGVEVGVDAVTQTGAVFNAKWRFKNDGLITPSLAVGVQNVGHDTTPQVYLVASKSLLPSKLVQLHAGVLHEEGGLVGMVGASAGMGPLSVCADRVQGNGIHRTSVGATIGAKGFKLTGIVYDVDKNPHENSLMLSYSKILF